MKGTEKGIEWEVTESRSPAKIFIRDLNGNTLHEEKYKWMIEPVFGPDCADVAKINEILDKLINTYGKEE